MSENRYSCYICKSEAVRAQRGTDNFLINKCKECGLIWVEGIAKDSLATFYGPGYFKSKSRMGYENYLHTEELHRKNARNIIRAVDQVRKLSRSRVLDIGCAFGFFMDELNKMEYCDVYGVEISNYASGYAMNRPGLKILNSEFDKSNFKPDFFDAVFLLGTIEHLPSPRETLSDINRILKKGGILVITTLNTRGLIPLFFIKPPEHIFYFSHKNLLLLLKELGYETLTKRLYFAEYRLHDLFYRLSKFSLLSFLGYLSRIIRNGFLDISLKVPTNEMLVIVEKAKEL